MAAPSKHGKRTLALAIGCGLVGLAAAPAIRIMTGDAGPHRVASAATEASSDAFDTATRHIDIVPAQMDFAGDVVDCAGAIEDPTVASWCQGVPQGTIIVGVRPTSHDPTHWRGGRAIVGLDVGEVTADTLAVIAVGWPHVGGKGIHSPADGMLGRVTWNGVPVWSRRTLDAGTYGDFYAAQRDDIKATAVITTGGTIHLALEADRMTAFDVSRVAVDLYPMWQGIRGIAYSPYRDCQNPNWGPFPTSAEVAEDIRALRYSSNVIRTYASAGIGGEVARIAGRHGLRVCAGAWLGPEVDAAGRPITANRDEIEALVALAGEVDLECAIVGNEVLLRGDLTEAQLLAYMEEVKRRVDVPVTTAEIGGVLRQHAAVIEASDWIMIHTYPSWDGRPISGAARSVVEDYLRWRDDFRPKPIVIGETGWPSAGPMNRQAAMNIENQRLFLTEFLALAERNSVDFFYFDALDELWKTEGGVGSHWGYCYSDRTCKHLVQSVLLPARSMPPRPIHLPAVLRSARPSADRWLPTPSPTAEPRFVVYDEYAAEENRFVPSGWMGDHADLDLYECDRSDPLSGQVALRVDYDPKGDQGWAGVVWQHPEGSWASTQQGGYDLDRASALRFGARGMVGGEKVRFQVGGLWGAYPDSLQPAVGTDLITLAPAWHTYEIDLRGRDLSRVVGGFAVLLDACSSPGAVSFLLDDIHFVTDGDPGRPSPTATPSGEYSLDVYTDRDVSVGHYAPSGFMGDTGDLTVEECARGAAHSGSTELVLSYAAAGQGPQEGCGGQVPCGWGAVAWLEPSGNWGDRPGGLDLAGAGALSLWLRGDKGGEKVTLRVGGIGCGTGARYADSVCPAVTMDPAPVTLGSDWQQLFLPLPIGTDLTRVVGGLTVALSAADNPGGAVIHLDDIRYLFNVDPHRWLQEHAVYVGERLTDGYDMGVNTSEGRTDWVTDHGGFMRMSYPAGQDWGAVFITVGPPTDRDRPGKVLSMYRTLSMEMRGAVGGEVVWIGLKDNTDPDDGSERKLKRTLSAQWSHHDFDLRGFDTADLDRLYVVTEFVFESGTPAEVVDFRNIRYLP